MRRTISQRAREIVDKRAPVYRLMFPDGTQLKSSKILKAKARDSVWWWWNPYILEITYKKSWEETYYTYVKVGKTDVPIPHQVHHETMDYTFKYTNINEIATQIRELRDSGVQVKNDIKPTSRNH
jgi:hypothetical protein